MEALQSSGSQTEEAENRSIVVLSRGNTFIPGKKLLSNGRIAYHQRRASLRTNANKLRPEKINDHNTQLPENRIHVSGRRQTVQFRGEHNLSNYIKKL